MERLNDHSGLKPERIYRLTACFLLEGQELMISSISLSYFRKPADKYKVLVCGSNQTETSAEHWSCCCEHALKEQKVEVESFLSALTGDIV